MTQKKGLWNVPKQSMLEVRRALEEEGDLIREPKSHARRTFYQLLAEG